MAVDRTPSTINKLKKAREIEEERRRIRALAKAKADAIAEERARLEEAQRAIRVSDDEAVDALSAGLTRQSLLLEDASQDGLTVEQTIAKLLVVVKNQEKLMRSELENKGVAVVERIDATFRSGGMGAPTDCQIATHTNQGTLDDPD
jgi:hypothetical protein